MSRAKVPDVLAAVDLGSNSFHMGVGRYSHGQILIIDRLREMVRLAAGLDVHGRLDRVAMDAALACLAKRFGWEVWCLPVACHHHGGLTAVADARYHAWARQQRPHGDLTFWAEAHRIVYDEFRDVLPIRV